MNHAVSSLQTSPSRLRFWGSPTAELFTKEIAASLLLDIWPELTREPSMPGWIANGFNGTHFDQGCGALNLVNVAEPLKIARLILGIDDSDPADLRWIPRPPHGWQGLEASSWPILPPPWPAAYGFAR